MTLGRVALPNSLLNGRDVEAARLDEIIEHLPDGGAALVGFGRGGRWEIGAAALWTRSSGCSWPANADHWVSSLRWSSRSLVCTSFCTPEMGLVELLPAPQRRALQAW
jgi:hypothetical protein